MFFYKGLLILSYNDECFTGSLESVAIFSPITIYIQGLFCGNIQICFWNFRNIRHEIYFNNTFTCLLCIYVQFNIM